MRHRRFHLLAGTLLLLSLAAIPSARALGSLQAISVSDPAAAPTGAPSILPRVSADGRYVAFVSNATNLVAGDTNGVSDIFVRDTLNGTTTRVSLDSAGAQANNSSVGADFFPSDPSPAI